MSPTAVNPFTKIVTTIISTIITRVTDVGKIKLDRYRCPLL